MLTLYVIVGVLFLAACIGEFDQNRDRPTQSFKVANRPTKGRRQKVEGKK
jgi:hypothetical protein